MLVWEECTIMSEGCYELNFIRVYSLVDDTTVTWICAHTHLTTYCQQESGLQQSVSHQLKADKRRLVHHHGNGKWWSRNIACGWLSITQDTSWCNLSLILNVTKNVTWNSLYLWLIAFYFLSIAENLRVRMIQWFSDAPLYGLEWFIFRAITVLVWTFCLWCVDCKKEDYLIVGNK